MAVDIRFLIDGADYGQPTNANDFGFTIAEESTINARIVSFNNDLNFTGGSFEYIYEKLIPFTRHTGPSLSAFNAWVLVKSLETMELRVTRMCENAQKLAEFLETRKEIKSVRYPGLASHPDRDVIKKQMKAGGTTIGIEFTGTQKDAFRFMDALRVIDISNNLGDSKSLITHPASTTHRRLAPDVLLEMGITPSVIRLSVGLEHIDDLLKDVTQALNS